MSRPKLLIAHPWMGRGGSEATAMWTLQALQDDCDLTFTTAANLTDADWEALNLTYGTRVDPSRLHRIKAPALPGVNGPHRLPHLQNRYFERHCHRIAPAFDLCVSTYNPIYFGQPAIHLIGDFSFSEEMRRRLSVHGEEPYRHRQTWLRRLYLAAGGWIELRKPPLREWDDLVLANSAWAARQLDEHFLLPGAGVLHPPVPLPTAPVGVERDPFGFVCLGRVVPEKEIERMVGILARVRGHGYPVAFTIVGRFDESDYARKIAGLVRQHNDWIRTPGFLQLEEKRAVLASHTFALHACRIEAFGIAVAEMAAVGCVPLVPETGGAGEIVPMPELQYSTDDEAVEKILSLLRNPAHVAALSEKMPESAARFAPARFVERLRESVLDSLRRPPRCANDELAEKNLPAAH
ncbi:MAG TPA: glycosyltransferase family 4 protein [Bacteroidia bacterium]|nr:glycosyltransferase family 4 protein [Bacteroidia bacterium]